MQIVKGQELDIDYEVELQGFTLEKERIRGNKLQACSPFREERTPSFAVNLDNGTWIDSGSLNEYERKGNFIQLLARLRNESYEDVEYYLIDKYGVNLTDTEALELHLNLYGEVEVPKTFSKDIIRKYMSNGPVDYITDRGIPTTTQQFFGIGLDRDRGAIVMPWLNNKGEVINIKYRKITEKTFFYEKGGQPVKNYVFGLYQCILRSAERVFLCESEIDAMYLWGFGVPAIAVGGSSINEKQIELILKANIKEIVIATDNDKVGHRFREVLKLELLGQLDLFDIDFPNNVKDINEMNKSQVHTMLTNIRKVVPNFI